MRGSQGKPNISPTAPDSSTSNGYSAPHHRDTRKVKAKAAQPRESERGRDALLPLRQRERITNKTTHSGNRSSGEGDGHVCSTCTRQELIYPTGALPQPVRECGAKHWGALSPPVVNCRSRHASRGGHFMLTGRFRSAVEMFGVTRPGGASNFTHVKKTTYDPPPQNHKNVFHDAGALIAKFLPGLLHCLGSHQ